MIRPLDSSAAWMACSPRAGFPMRMAVATVSGLSTGCPSTSGAAPAAWTPNTCGKPVDFKSLYCLKPAQYEVILPALPTGKHNQFGAESNTSQISNAAVFCPSMRYGLIEFTKQIGCLFVMFTTIVLVLIHISDPK